MDIDPADPENAAGVRYVFRRGLVDSAATWFDESSFGSEKKPKWEDLVEAFCQRYAGMSRAEVEAASQEGECGGCAKLRAQVGSLEAKLAALEAKVDALAG